MPSHPRASRRSRATTKTEFAEQELRAALAAGEIRPGEAISIGTWSERLGVSATPVREAVRVLQAEGLIDVSPHRVVSVASLSSSDIVELYALRAAAESLAARFAAVRMSAEQIAELRATYNEMRASSKQPTLDAFMAAHDAFHRAIYDGSATRYVRRTCYNLWSVARWHAVWSQPGRLQKSLNEHRALLIAIEKHDPDAAETAASSHLMAGAVAASRTADTAQRSLPAGAKSGACVPLV